MTTLADWLYTLGMAGADLFWRPLLAWTLIAIPVYLGLRLWKDAPPLVQYRAHLALLLALPLSLLLTPLIPAATVSLPLAGALPDLPPPAAVAPPAVPLPPGVDALPALPALAAAEPAAWSLAHLLGVATLVALGMGLFLLARVGVLALHLYRYQATLTPLVSEDVHDRTRRLAREVGVDEPVTLLLAPPQTTPMTFGWRAPVIVLPADLLEDDEALRMTLVHELIHVRRRDYAASWVVRLTTCLFAVHPGVWLLQRRIEQYRELSCDAEALAERHVAPRPYAELLLRFSPLTDPAGPMALRMVELDAILKQRLAAMKSALHNSPRLLRWTLPVAAIVLLIPALFAACSASFTNSETVAVGSDAPPAPVAAPEAPPPPPTVVELRAQAGEAVVRPDQETDVMIQARRAYEEALRQVERAAAQADQMAAQVDRERLQRELAELQAVQGQAFAQQAKIKAQFGGGDLTEELNRLKVQMTYLEKELTKLGEQINAVEAKPHGERNQVEWALYRQRAELLQNMYRERLEAYETLKMEVYTEEVLGEEK